ncbi:MAG: hypothetical protein WBO92_01565 [Candidatus Moraniibacteriota bacterium]
MKKFLVLYLVPVATLEAWMKTDPETRQAEEGKMKEEWSVWMKEHGAAMKETWGAGKTKLVTKGGTSDIKNDVMLFSIVEAESAEAAAKPFESHPHLGIPEASIEIMPMNDLSGM